MTVRLNPAPVQQTDLPPWGIVLGAFSTSMATVALAYVRGAGLIDFPNWLFWTGWVVLVLVWFCFVAAAVALAPPRPRLWPTLRGIVLCASGLALVFGLAEGSVG